MILKIFERFHFPSMYLNLSFVSEVGKKILLVTQEWLTDLRSKNLLYLHEHVDGYHVTATDLFLNNK